MNNLNGSQSLESGAGGTRRVLHRRAIVATAYSSSDGGCWYTYPKSQVALFATH